MRVCVSHPGLGAGGSEARAMVLLEALQTRYDTTLVTGAPFECERLNRAYGTNVDPARIKVRIAPMPAMVRHMQAGDALRGAWFGRFVRKIGPEYDLCISAYNFAGFGRPALQFVADFSWDDDIRREFDPDSPGLRGMMQKPGPARASYLWLARRIGGGKPNASARQQDIVIANSHWTAGILAERHGLRSQVIYPPVASPPPLAQPRSQDFVMLGRIVPDKRILEAIDILDRVRQRGHSFQFHIVGKLEDDAYSLQVRRKAALHAGWVRLTGGLYGEDKFDFLNRHGFALHMHKREAFGIAVAEMVKMGLVPFVPAGSAPAEIVGDPRLTFVDDDDAVHVIDTHLRRPDDLDGIREGLAGRGALFSSERFAAEALALVEEQVAMKAERAG